MCIAIGYAVIISYVLNGLLHAITGNLMTVNPGKWFESFAFHDFSVVPLHLAIVVITLLTLIFGADSIEKTNKIMMPLFFLLFVFMAIRILLLPNAFEGYKFILLLIGSNLPIQWYGCGQWDKPSSPFPLQEAE